MRILILKELQDYLSQGRFIITSVLIIAVFIINGITFLAKYQSMLLEYEENANLNRKAYGSNMLGLFMQESLFFQKKPLPIQFCVTADETLLPNCFEVNAINQREVASSRHVTENFLVKKSIELDWVFIIGVLLSFVVVVITFDSITGEKENGTLRLALSNSIPRDKYLLSKFYGAFFTLIIPLSLGVVGNLIIIALSKPMILNLTLLARVGLIFLLGVIYLACFIWIGIFISAITKNSSTSLILLLFLWVLVVILVPASGGIIARIFYPIPRASTIEQQVEQVLMQPKIAEEEITAKGEQIDIDQFARLDAESFEQAAKIRNEFRNHKFRQVNLAQTITLISPYSVFNYAAEAIAGVGIVRHKVMLSQLKAYREKLDQFILQQTQKGFGDKLKAKYITWRVAHWGAFDNDQIPKFEETRMPIGSGLQAAMLDLLLLFLFVAIFFVAGFVAFVRYDVR